MMTPTIHLNGTSRNALLDQVTEAGRAAHQFLQKLYDAAPNGRDYYTQGSGAFGQALTEHQARIDRVKRVLAELEELMEAIADDES